MSRRAKLLITSLFLALLSIPTIYVALTWHPQNPLRFRMLSVKQPTLPTADIDFFEAEIEIEVINTSSTPISIRTATFYQEADVPPRRVGVVQVDSGTVVEGHIDGGDMLSGNGRFHFKGRIHWTKKEPVDHYNLRVNYDFISRTKQDLWEKYWSFRRQLPETWSERLPVPDFSRGVAPLEPAH